MSIKSRFSQYKLHPATNTSKYRVRQWLSEMYGMYTREIKYKNDDEAILKYCMWSIWHGREETCNFFRIKKSQSYLHVHSNLFHSQLPRLHEWYMLKDKVTILVEGEEDSPSDREGQFDWIRQGRNKEITRTKAWRGCLSSNDKHWSLQ